MAVQPEVPGMRPRPLHGHAEREGRRGGKYQEDRVDELVPGRRPAQGLLDNRQEVPSHHGLLSDLRAAPGAETSAVGRVAAGDLRCRHAILKRVPMGAAG